MKCCTVRDLLPLYAEQLTSEETAAEIRAHLAQCADCAAVLRSMPDAAAPLSPPADLRPLKAVRKHSRRKMLVFACIAAVLAVLFYRYEIAGVQLRSDQIHLEISTYWNYQSETGGHTRNADTRAELEQITEALGAGTCTEMIRIEYDGDCIEWRNELHSTPYQKERGEPDFRIPSVYAWRFYGVLLPETLHRSYWAHTGSSQPLTDGSVLTFYCADGDFAYDLCELANLAHNAPDGKATFTVGEKLPQST